MIEYAAKVFSDIISSVEKSGAKYAVLYVTDPYRSISYPSYREVERFLAEGPFGNGSANSTTCDEVCQIKSSLLEGLFIVSCTFLFPIKSQSTFSSFVMMMERILNFHLVILYNLSFEGNWMKIFP